MIKNYLVTLSKFKLGSTTALLVKNEASLSDEPLHTFLSKLMPIQIHLYANIHTYTPAHVESNSYAYTQVIVTGFTWEGQNMEPLSTVEKKNGQKRKKMKREKKKQNKEFF